MFAPNRNLLWTRVLVDELARAGLRAVAIAPGSRSTPLALACHAHPQIKSYLHLDERSAAFFALGWGQAQNQPAAVICTSGTAAANFYPAIVEAHQSQIPLLVLTTDRPPELRHSGANQTIDQIKMYGDFVRFFADVPLPESDPTPLVLRHLRTLAARAYAEANGLVKGAVHLNLPFRPPLEPTPVPSDNTEGGYADRPERPYVVFSQGILTPSPAQIDDLAAIMAAHPQGIIVCGPRCPAGDFPQAVSELSRRSGYPIFAEPLSNVRFGPHLANTAILGAYDNLPLENIAPQVVIRFGKVPTSKTLNSFLDRITPTYRILVSGEGVWADDSHRQTHFVHADPTQVCCLLTPHLPARPDSAWAKALWEADQALWERLDQGLMEHDFDGAIYREVVDLLPDDALVFVGNSLPVRHLEEFGRPATKKITVFGNRGASGIDGVTSTALGIAAARDQHLTLLIGDISFYHDLSGLLALPRHQLKMTIVLFNNDGGGIFHRLPIAKFEPPFTELFITPHGLEFSPIAQFYGLEYARVQTRQEFSATFARSLAAGRATLIEYQSNAPQDLQQRNTLKKSIQAIRAH